jgi:hypothetical protein
MSIEMEMFGVTGPLNAGNSLLPLAHPPSTGINGVWDVALDPIDGPAQVLGVDFGVTHYNPAGTTGAIALNLVNSDIKKVLNNPSNGCTGVLWLRVVYNYV